MKPTCPEKNGTQRSMEMALSIPKLGLLPRLAEPRRMGMRVYIFFLCVFACPVRKNDCVVVSLWRKDFQMKPTCPEKNSGHKGE